MLSILNVLDKLLKCKIYFMYSTLRYNLGWALFLGEAYKNEKHNRDKILKYFGKL